LLALTEGHINPIEKVRTAARALSRLEELALEALEAAGESGVDIAVHHLDSQTRASDLVDRLQIRAPSSTTVILVELGAAVGAHVGPGTIAVAVSPRPGGGQV
jgi:fatty acid-binding protein DegV